MSWKLFWPVGTIVAALTLVAPFAHAEAHKIMPIEFVGDWCFSGQEKQETTYSLPSWIGEDGHCTKILSVDPYGFYANAENCEAMKVQLTHDTAPSGTAYTALITARCNPTGVVISSTQQVTIKTFKFYRYKGTLIVTAKGDQK